MGKPAQAARFQGAARSIKSEVGDGNLSSEIEFVNELESDLQAELGASEVARIFAEVPDLETALLEAFPH
jgi:hypothetical protein